MAPRVFPPMSPYVHEFCVHSLIHGRLIKSDLPGCLPSSLIPFPLTYISPPREDRPLGDLVAQGLLRIDSQNQIDDRQLRKRFAFLFRYPCKLLGVSLGY